MNAYNDVEFKEIPKDEECYVTAVKIGEIIGEPASRVRKWAEYHEDNLYIKKVNGRFVYTEKSIEQFKFIQALKQEKNMTHEQIKQHMKKHGMHYSQYDGGLIDPKDPFGYEGLSTAIAQKTQNQLNEFLANFIKYQEQNNVELINSVKTEVEQTVHEQLEDSMRDIEKELQEQKEENKKLSEQLEKVQDELSIAKEASIKSSESLKNKIQENLENMSNRIIEENNKTINEFKCLSLEQVKEQTQPKGLLEKIFGRKK